MMTTAMSWTISEGEDFDAARAMALIEELERESAHVRPIKTRPGRKVFRIPTRHTGGGVLIAKYHCARSFRERLKYAVLPTRAAREWKNAERLRVAGVPVPDMLALGECYAHGLWARAVLFARAVAPGTALNDQLLTSPPAAEVRRLAARLAAHVAHLHDAGYQAGDLHGWNILLRQTGDGLDLCFVDLDEMRVRRRSALRRCAADLARLGVLAPARRFTKMRFLVNYLRARHVPRQRWRKWIGEIAKRAARIAAGLKQKYGREPDEFIRWFAAERQVKKGDCNLSQNT